MALVLKNIFTPGVDQINQNYIIESWHVSQSVDAFTGTQAYNITLSGSYTLTGSQYVTGSISSSGGTNTVGFYGTSSWAVSSSKAISSSFATTASYIVSSSYASTSSLSTTASYYPYGTNALTYGAFSDRTTQTVTAGTSASLTYDTTDLSNGVTIGSPSSRLVISKTGIYNIQFSIQIAASGGGNSNAYIWLRKNGVNQTYTNTGIYLQNANDKHVAAWNFVLSLNAGDYLELVMWAIGGDVQALTETPIPGTGPTGNGNVGVPSIIATLTQIT